jgi:G3E family GTPase
MCFSGGNYRISKGGYRMNILVLLGPPAAGKSTLARNTLVAGILGKTAYILNDDATTEGDETPQMFDATVEISSLTELKTMGEGCFGCSDEATLIRELRNLEQTRLYDTVLLEPFGFISGDELPKALSRNGLGCEVITLLDVQNIENNRAWGIVPSQLAGATVGIGLTKCSAADAESVSVEGYLSEHAPGKPTFLLGISDPLPTWAVDQIGKAKSSHSHHEHCGHGCSHDHDHHHHHEHVHPDLKYSFLLRKEIASTEMVRALAEAFRDQKNLSMRVKGIIAGNQFQGQLFSKESTLDQSYFERQITWTEDANPTSKNMITFYVSRPISSNFLSGLVLNENHRIAQSTKELLRRADNCTTEESISLLRSWIAKCPKRVQYGVKGPIVYTEATEAVNELRKRADVFVAAPELVEEAICSRVDHAIRVVQENLPGTAWHVNQTASEWKRDCAITIAWFALHRAEVLGKERMEIIHSLHLDDLLAAGLAGLEQFNSDPEKARVFAEESGDVARLLGSVSRQLKEQYRRCYLLALGWDKQHESHTADLWYQVYT